MKKSAHRAFGRLLRVILAIVLVCSILPSQVYAEMNYFLVVFDPDDGISEFGDFYKTTVAEGSTVTDRPDDPQRDGYVFAGWYGYLDAEDNPVLWDFKENAVTENTTLWAAWEKAHLVVFDPDDGITVYEDFYKTTVGDGRTVTDRPDDPQRDGYTFRGWYGYLDAEDNPVLWDFKENAVTDNTTLWAAWEKEDSGEGNTGGSSGGGSSSSGGSSGGGSSSSGGSSGGGSNSSGGNNDKITDLEEAEIPGGATDPDEQGNTGDYEMPMKVNPVEIPQTGTEGYALAWWTLGISGLGIVILAAVSSKRKRSAQS